jgi:two-component system, NtrC family, response regulator AtoC
MPREGRREADMDEAEDGARSGALTTIEGNFQHPAGPVQLVALGPHESFVAYDLPREGTITIGREGTDVDLRDRRVSRQHARLHIAPGATFAIEDLGSANGTQVGRERLAPGQRVPVAVGEAIFIGSTIAMLQPRPDPPRARKIVPAIGFEARLAEESARHLASGGGFTVILMEVLDGFYADRLVETAAEHLGTGGIFAGRDGTSYAAIIPNVASETQTPGADAHPFLAALERLAPAVVSGQARFPRDAGTPEGLLATARARVESACTIVPASEQVIFCDKLMRRLYELARRAAGGLVNVLILGETGVGKDVMARAIHRCSPRSDKPFQRVECAALTEALAESELFGHERGAFTGALTGKAGLIEAADGGTVFLDEVGELTPRLQAKLLHVLENRETTRVGAVKGRAIDVRFIAATNRNLEEDVARGDFRKDLYYRLNGFSLAIPPLRERRSEIVPLARAMLRETCRQLGRPAVPQVSAASVASLESFDWPGNVRELRNLMERALLLCDGSTIETEHLPFEAQDDRATVETPAIVTPSSFSAAELDEKRRIEEALAACGGNQRRAAEMLGIGRSTLILRLDAFGITRPRKPGP